MSVLQPIKQFINSIEILDYQLLQTKENVEKYLILPMFQNLDYPDNFRHDKYILKHRNAENKITNSEINQVYFTTDNLQEQNADTSLILVEIQEPRKNDLEKAIEKAKLYSDHLKPLFFIVTDGYYIKVFQCWRYYWEELIFDVNIDSLKNLDTASKFYHKLNFDFVKNINKKTSSILNNTNHIFIKKYLRKHPDLQIILEKGDFKPNTIYENKHLIVVKPKVAIECNLPQAFGEGNCVIEFSSNTLRGLRINLTHQNILEQLMSGLKTRPHWGCRNFLKKLDNNTFEVYLGQITLILSEIEIVDLCLCVDIICQEYQNTIIEFENILETWNYQFIQFSEIRGFQLFSVEQRLWELIQNFANEFNYAQGKSEWHIFHQEEISIRVSRGICDHAFILPKAGSNLSLLPNTQVHLVYQINDVHLQSLEHGKLTSWENDIGIKGTWTARYTKQWLLEKFIPKVISHYYSQELQLSEVELLSKIINYQYEHKPIKEIENIKDLIYYLRDVQNWLNNCDKNIAALLLRAYYQAFTELVKNTDSAIIGMDYIVGTLRGLEWSNTSKEVNSSFVDGNFKDVWNYLNAQVVRIKNCEYESCMKADLMTRVFIWIIEYNKISYSQWQMNNAKLALVQVWELSRFEMRYVYPRK